MDTNETNKIEVKKEWGEAAAKFIDALQLESVRGNYSVAAQVAGVNRTYMSQLMAKFPDFHVLCKSIKDEAKKHKAEAAESVLMKLVKDENVTAVIFALKKYNPEEFGDRGVDKPSDPIRHELSDEFRRFLGDGEHNTTESKSS